MAKQKHYVVWVGKKPGIYTSWTDCQQQVNKFAGAKFKAFDSKAAAEAAFKAGWKPYWGQGEAAGSGSAVAGKPQQTVQQTGDISDEIDYNSISVDAGTHGNPGPVEYRGVDTKTGEVIFSRGPIAKGTNNLGEFLALVHALSYLKKTNSGKNVYSDSANAIKWVKQKAVSSTLVRDESTKEIWDLVDRSVEWLRGNTYTTKIMKWETQSWGEIKADYGRK
ncbi:ribonuclease H [Paenibacillus sp. GCM10027626]|uniref:ribonuclease H n=1 Tax=Paenibacillus sp. GCM10027626 TaxID=3273411 RepID=UPI0036339801